MDARAQSASPPASEPVDVAIPVDSSNRPVSPDQIVLRGLPIALRPEPPVALWQDLSRDRHPPVPLLNALQGLIDLILEVRSPESGWDPTLPQTPETVLPYVSEEAGMVVAAWQDWQTLRSPTPNPAAGLPTLSAVMADWLWQLAGLSPGLMQRLGGFSGRVFSPVQGWQTGQLRLVATMTLATVGEFRPESSLNSPTASPPELQTWDLATGQPPRSRLASADTLIQVGSDPPQWTQGWLQTWVTAVQQRGAIAAALTTPVPVEMLQPGQTWRSGQLQLNLGLEFQAEAPVAADPPSPATTHPTLGFVQCIDPDWLAAWQGTRSRRLILPDRQYQLHQALTAAIAAAPTATEASTDLDLTLLQLIWATLAPETIAGDVIATLSQGSLTEHLAVANTPLSPTMPLPLAVWLDDLQWLLTRCHPAIARLLGGVSARYLPPGDQWRSGYVRLRAELQFQPASPPVATLTDPSPRSPTHRWDISGFTAASGLTPTADSVVQLLDPDCQTAPWPTDALLDRIQQDIHHSGSELTGWLHGTEIRYDPDAIGSSSLSQRDASLPRLQGAEPVTGQTGWLQLTLGLEFYPQLTTHFRS